MWQLSGLELSLVGFLYGDVVNLLLLDEQAITNIIKRHITPNKKQKQINLIIYYTKFRTSNLIVKNNTNSVKIHLNQTNVVYKFYVHFESVSWKTKIILTLAIQPRRYLAENDDFKTNHYKLSKQ